MRLSLNTLRPLFNRGVIKNMVKIKKKSGELADFELSKLENTVVKAGVSENLAKEIAGSVKVEEGMETSNLRAQIVTALQARDSDAAKRYEEFEK